MSFVLVKIIETCNKFSLNSCCKVKSEFILKRCLNKRIFDRYVKGRRRDTERKQKQKETA